MFKPFLSLFTLLCLGAFAAAFGSSTSAGDPSRFRLAAPACTGAQLSVRVDPDLSNGATAGQRSDVFLIKNVSQSKCTIVGKPGVALLDRRGRAMGKAIKPTRKGATITLAPGGVATLEVFYHSCEFLEGAIEGGNPKKCKNSQTAQVRFSGITRVFSTPEKIDAHDGFERIMSFAAR
jgi:hypothetical protein